MNRLYYAGFYGVSAVLLERQQSFRKHSGVRAAFHRQFIKTGLLDAEGGRLYDQLFEDRQEGDYVVFVAFEPEYVRLQMERCSEFLLDFCRMAVGPTLGRKNLVLRFFLPKS